MPVVSGRAFPGGCWQAMSIHLQQNRPCGPCRFRYSPRAKSSPPWKRLCPVDEESAGLFRGLLSGVDRMPVLFQILRRFHLRIKHQGEDCLLRPFLPRPAPAVVHSRAGKLRFVPAVAFATYGMWPTGN